jgi:hypothetical protein
MRLKDDTFSIMRHQLARATSQLHIDPTEQEAPDELDDDADAMSTILRFYEKALSERGTLRFSCLTGPCRLSHSAKSSTVTRQACRHGVQCEGRGSLLAGLPVSQKSPAPDRGPYEGLDRSSLD